MIGVAPVRRPVKVALLSAVLLVKTKSSADSISIFPPLLGRDAVAIFPSGLPVLKKKGVAAAGVAVRSSGTTAAGVVRKRRALTSTSRDIAGFMFAPP